MTISSGAGNPCAALRFGHAYWSAVSAGDPDDVGLVNVVHILRGEAKLEPRTPADSTVVFHAEKLLEAKGRLVYFFCGCLHPKLGTIGLVVRPACAAGCLQGASRCDTGGLVGRKGAFEHVPDEQVEAALKALSFSPASVNAWETAFSEEIKVSYPNTHGYISGHLPNYSTWNDVRSRCLDQHLKKSGLAPDRRVWTWEIRLTGSPKPDDFEGLVLSYEAYKRLEHLRRSGTDIPTKVRVIHGTSTPAGVHFFEEEAVASLLGGE